MPSGLYLIFEEEKKKAFAEKLVNETNALKKTARLIYLLEALFESN